MDKREIADVLNEIAVLLELKGENPFKTRAYQSGARVLETMEDDLGTIIADDRLQSVKGIGEALGKKIKELHATGKLAFYDDLKASIAPGLVQMLEIPGLGAKKVKAVHDRLGVDSIESLTKACTEGRVAELAGFGEKSQQKILEGIKNREAYGRRHLWWDASDVAEPILAGLQSLPQVKRAAHAGSLRRSLETVGDLDFIVAATDVAPVFEWFTTRPGVKEVTARGETKASVRYESGLQADLRIVPEEQFAFALHHFTGSKDHNVQMRQRALSRGLSLSEWGLAPAEGEGTTKAKVQAASSPVQAATEEELFRKLGLAFIPPELREGLGEIESAEANALPVLVELADIRGAFHNHTTASDGRASLTEMVTAAQALGWEYLGIADHSKASFQANGLTEDQVLRQVGEIRALNASKKFKTHVFAGSEVDILKDGRLDFDENVRRELDYVVVSVHNAFSGDEASMTARIVRAIEQPHVTMLGHLTGRLLLRRPGYLVDTPKIVDAAVANGVVIELNASPNRLDMDWRHWRKAAEKGLITSINPDAHDVAGLQLVRAGVAAARKGWLTKENVLNARPLQSVEAFLKSKK